MIINILKLNIERNPRRGHAQPLGAEDLDCFTRQKYVRMKLGWYHHVCVVDEADVEVVIPECGVENNARDRWRAEAFATPNM